MNKIPNEILIINEYLYINDAVYYNDKKCEGFLDFDFWIKLTNPEKYKSRVITIEEYENEFECSVEDSIKNEYVDANDIDCFVEFTDLTNPERKVYVAVYNY